MRVAACKAQARHRPVIDERLRSTFAIVDVCVGHGSISCRLDYVSRYGELAVS